MHWNVSDRSDDCKIKNTGQKDKASGTPETGGG